MKHFIHAIVAFAIALAGCGCGPSVWERSFELEPGAAAAPPTTAAVVREAPWGRVGPALQAESERIINSDTHRDEWTTDQARENELAILAALQLPLDADGARLLGRSHFKTTQATDPTDGGLARFAGSIGADYAIYASQRLGKAETIEHEPVSRDRWRWDRIWDADRDRFIYVRRWDPETVWVPIVIARDEVLWVVFYIKQSS